MRTFGRRSAWKDTVRAGLRHVFSPHSVLLASVARGTVDATRESSRFVPDFQFETSDTGYTGELQHILRWEPFQLVTGVGHLDGTRTSASRFFGGGAENGFARGGVCIPARFCSVP